MAASWDEAPHNRAMDSTSALSLALLDQNQLYVEYHTSLGRCGAYLLPLDTRIGNHEGKFHPGGHSFSFSARDIVLKRNILHAKLKSSKGVWWDDQLQIDVNASTVSTSVTLSIEFRRCDHLRLEGCHNMRLIDETLLATEYLEPNAKVKDLYLDLNQFIGVENGAFDRHEQYFLDHVQKARIIGSTLYAIHTKTGHQISIDLSSVLRLRDGAFLPLREAEAKDLDYEILTDSSNKNWLSNADTIRLVNYKQKRAWYLIANCLSSRGTLRESTIKLHKIIGPHDDEMFSFFSEPSIPEYARITRFNNGTLTASFNGNDGKWVQRSFDLAELVNNEGGTLTK